MLTMEMLEDARMALQGIARQTPLDPARGLGKNVYIKAENLQLTGAFKLRGAYNKIRSLSREEAARGVIACSAGNHVRHEAGHQIHHLYACRGAHQQSGGHPGLRRRGHSGPRRL